MQLLLNAAREFKSEVESFSKSEISKQINEIKYLSAQKKVPKLTLRKEIVHLENKFKNVMELEKRLAHKKSKEQRKITSLKRQVTMLRNKLHASEDKDIIKKVEKLSHLLGDYMAKCGTAEDVALSKKLLKEIHTEIREPKEKRKKTAAVTKPLEKEDTTAILMQRAENMQVRLNSLKHEISIHKELGSKSPEQIKELEAKVDIIEEKMKGFYASHPELTQVKVQETSAEKTVQHKMLFAPVKPEERMEEELPLPPPPRVEE